MRSARPPARTSIKESGQAAITPALLAAAARQALKRTGYEMEARSSGLSEIERPDHALAPHHPSHHPRALCDPGHAVRRPHTGVAGARRAAHYNYVRFVATTGGIPVLQMGDYPHGYMEEIKSPEFPPDLSIDPIRYEFHQPPLYYALLAPIYALVRGALLPLRLALGAAGAGRGAAGICDCPRVILKRAALALGAAAFVAFLPQHLATGLAGGQRRAGRAACRGCALHPGRLGAGGGDGVRSQESAGSRRRFVDDSRSRFAPGADLDHEDDGLHCHSAGGRRAHLVLVARAGQHRGASWPMLC